MGRVCVVYPPLFFFNILSDTRKEKNTLFFVLQANPYLTHSDPPQAIKAQTQYCGRRAPTLKIIPQSCSW